MMYHKSAKYFDEKERAAGVTLSLQASIKHRETHAEFETS